MVDNCSSLNDAAQISAMHPEAEVMISQTNLGFAGGNNLAIAVAVDRDYDYIFLINNDTILEEGCLEQLAKCAAENPTAGIIAPLMYRYPERTLPWFTGSTIDSTTGATTHSVDDVRSLGLQKPYEAPWITGCAMFISRETLKRLGGFDARYFCYYEDTDLSLRYREAGMQLLVCPVATIYHKVGASAGEGSLFQHYYMTRNKLLCFAQHSTGKAKRAIVWKLTRDVLVPTVRIMRHNRGSIPSSHLKVAAIATLHYYLRKFGHTYKPHKPA